MICFPSISYWTYLVWSAIGFLSSLEEKLKLPSSGKAALRVGRRNGIVWEGVSKFEGKSLNDSVKTNFRVFGQFSMVGSWVNKKKKRNPTAEHLCQRRTSGVQGNKRKSPPLPIVSRTKFRVPKGDGPPNGLPNSGRTLELFHSPKWWLIDVVCRMSSKILIS